LAFGELAFGELPFGELTFGELAFGEMTFGELPLGELTFGELPFGELRRNPIIYTMVSSLVSFILKVRIFIRTKHWWKRLYTKLRSSAA
jgi:hypothetical protein